MCFLFPPGWEAQADVRSDDSVYGGILWSKSAGTDDAITVMRVQNAIGRVAQLTSRCGDEERWGIVDLRTLNVVLTGGTDRYEQSLGA